MKTQRGWSSHIYVLTKMLLQSEGPVLELGMGIFSTPLIHWLCADKDREYISCENDEKYFNLLGNFNKHKHSSIFVKDWNELDVNRPWGLAFVDLKPEELRKDFVKKLANLAKFIVIHDSDPSMDGFYHYSEVYPLFKYIYHYTKFSPNTSVLSNFEEIKI